MQGQVAPSMGECGTAKYLRKAGCERGGRGKLVGPAWKRSDEEDPRKARGVSHQRAADKERPGPAPVEHPGHLLNRSGRVVEDPGATERMVDCEVPPSAHYAELKDAALRHPEAS